MTGVPFFDWPKLTDEEKLKIEIATKIARFLNQPSSEVTLSESFKEELPKGPIFQTKSLREIAEINMVELLLKSEYRDLAESMNSNELKCLSSMFSKDSVKGHFPKSIIRNRAYAGAIGEMSIRTYVTRYLSPNEKLLLKESDPIDELDNILLNAYVQDRTPMVVFAAIAEVIAVRGFSKGLEVASELKHLRTISVFDLKVYEATVALIAEELEVTDDEIPFGWAAQMSEHSWVLSSHIPKRIEIALKV